MCCSVQSPEIEALKLHNPLPWYLRLYSVPFLSLYPVLAYAYYVKYDSWLQSEEWTFLACLTLGAGHVLSFLLTQWSIAMKARLTCVPSSDLRTARLIQVVPKKHRGKGEIIPLHHKITSMSSEPVHTFSYSRDTYNYNPATQTFTPLPYPADANPPLSLYKDTQGLTAAPGPTNDSVPTALENYGKNLCEIPIPKFTELFAEHAVAPFFVFQMFCVALWCLDEYWYYSIFTGFMLIVFECTVVFQRVRTLTEFRTMSVPPYPVQAFRDGEWSEVNSDQLVPGDVISIVRTKPDSALPCDLLVLSGTAIVNEAMLSGESTPLLKESIELREGSDRLDMNGSDRNNVLFSGTKALQVHEGDGINGKKAPDAGCTAVVLRTGFGTAQGQLVRTMLFSTEAVTAGNLESFIFIGFLLIFAIAASAYVWIHGVEKGMKKSKLLLDCVLIITSVVPPELPMELSMAVNASLAALSKYAIFCTEPFRISFAGRVDVCCFDKTGTITGEDLVVEGVAGLDKSDLKKLLPITETGRETTLTLASSHALVQLEDGTIVGDPMEKTTLEALGWQVGKGNTITPKPDYETEHKVQISIKRRFQFSSALKRMSTISVIPEAKGGKKNLVSVKGAPETLKTMYAQLPENYDETYKWFTRRGSRVLALGWKNLEGVSTDQINHIPREKIEGGLTFAGFLVFHCPLKPDAVESLKMLSDSSHRCIMITGDNPLTAVHVAREVEIVDRDVLILDIKEGATSEKELIWRSVDESIMIPVDPSAPFDKQLFADYDICITGIALKQYEHLPSWHDLILHTWVYARVSPAQKEFILSTFKNMGYTTLMAGDGTNDVGALKQAHIGVALLDGSAEDLKKIAEHQKNERLKKVYEQQCSLSARFNQPPPPVPAAIRDVYPELVKAQQLAHANQQIARKKNPMEKFDLASITNKLADMDDENEPPKIKLGDASCAAPFTSKLSNVAAITHIIRQGRCTLVATVQMYKILALNCLITAYSLSVQYLDGIKFGDYQMSITGMLMSVCFMCISRAKPIDKLSRERPLGNILNIYVLLSILLQFAIHIVALLYMTNLSKSLEDRGPIDLDAKYEPSLLNTAIYLLGLSQQVSTFAINFQGRPFREGISENRPLLWGLMGAVGVAYSGSTDFFPELNKWLQLVDMSPKFKFILTTVMLADFGGCYVVEKGCKYLFADLEPKELITRGRERREKRRAAEELALEAKKDL
ncbi:endoplasmic reticulum ca-transporting p-type atpase [Phaffia rhodozyma]|uniref:Endoplasmic reticulum ca-transporting P-type atpase n=1 Tax=Phaffia rhodozyma TaxID=264483 RepID=A0A0F7SXL9_PHARH|nr:endoplasmic reticulum ca-transporting p-type atpase [Phaffia rhodozyma]